jgi:magnesium transporter
MVAAFEGTIEKAAALAVFMPIVAGQGGNAGIQTITIVVRGMALGEIELEDARRVLAKEIAIGLLKGLVIGTVVGLVALFWQDDWSWGLVVFAALTLNMVVAGAVGSLIPIGLRAAKLDPAVASGIFLTMVTDVAGFFFLLGLATVFIV